MAEERSLRERLIDVGADLVLTEGTASVGLREIARRAGVSHGAPRRHFPTHQALLSAIARRGFDDLGARFAAATAAVPAPRDRLAALARAYVGYARERRGMFELMFRHDLLDGGQREEAGQPPLRASTLPLFRRIVELVELCRAESADAARRGGPGGTPVPPETTAAALWANLHGIVQLAAWGSLGLALGDLPQGGDHVDRLVSAALDAHLGPVVP
ncbi:TetR/AcrR family transcriptional regulator [Streptomyces sp. PTD5-9]|uniref:TetR/AcrR family transcriptional regulator n=1 Tax=Streptomyces sp. PTD5-9 TaxID=3120150 RepID=UPI00300A88BB